MSALAWRVYIRQRGSEKDDPIIIRHAHNLAALEHMVIAATTFKTLLVAAMTADTGRGGRAPVDPAERFAVMLDRLATDTLWADEYVEFVRNVSFARAEETIAFADALEATKRPQSLMRDWWVNHAHGNLPTIALGVLWPFHLLLAYSEGVH